MFPEGRLLDFLIVGAVALIVVGPKDLPLLMRKLGAFVAKMRGMAAEFRASFDELARQSELDELRKEVETMRRATPLGAATSAIQGDETQAVFDDIHASLRGGAVQFPPAADPAPPVGEATLPEGLASAPAATVKTPRPRSPRKTRAVAKPPPTAKAPS